MSINGNRDGYLFLEGKSGYLSFNSEFSEWEVLLLLQLSKGFVRGLLGSQLFSDCSGLLVSDINWLAFLSLILGSDGFSVLLVDDGQVFGDGFSHNLIS